MLKMSKHGIVQKDQALFTAQDIINLLANLDDLNGHKIRLRENIDGSLLIQIDTNIYSIWDETEIDLYKEQTI